MIVCDTYGRFTLDYIENTGPIQRVGLVTIDREPIDTTGDEDTLYEEIFGAANALADRPDKPNDWRVEGNTVEMMFERDRPW